MEKVFRRKKKIYFKKKFLWRLIICWRLNQVCLYTPIKFFFFGIRYMKIGKLVFPQSKNIGIKIIKSESNLYVDQIQITQIIFHPIFIVWLLHIRNKNLFNLYSEHVFIKANWIAFNTITIANWHLPVNKKKCKRKYIFLCRI